MRNHPLSNLRLRLVDSDDSAPLPLDRHLIKIGSCSSSDLQLPRQDVQRMHAVVEVNEDGTATIIDLNTAAGTRLNGRRIEKASLKAGDRIALGDGVIVVESAPTLPARIAKAVELDHSSISPSLFSRPAPAKRGLTPSYRMIAAAPPLAPDFAESDHDAVEVRVYWGDNLLCVEHRSANESFTVGEGADFVLPPSCSKDKTLTLYRAGQVSLIGSERAEIVAKDGAIESMTQPVTITTGTIVRQQLGELRFEVEGIKAVKKKLFNRGLFALASSALVYIIGSFLGHAGLLAAMATMMPPLGVDADETISQEQRYLISHYLNVSAERERDEQQAESLENPGDELRDEDPGRSGVRSKGSEGTAGDPTSQAQNRRMGVQGQADETRLSRRQILDNAANSGMVGLINSSGGIDPDAPTSPWGSDTSLGSDELSARGNMFGSSIGGAFGQDALGLTGIGEGGGGLGEGYGVSDIGTSGNGFGDVNGSGFGSRLRRKYGKHKARTPVLRMTGTSVSGRIPAGVIQRIVRSNYGRFRACYQSGLRNNPSLQGRVMVRFIIGRDGRVQGASGGGDLPDNGVVSCVARSFSALSFPRPDNGVVTVSYGIVFSPAS